MKHDNLINENRNEYQKENISDNLLATNFNNNNDTSNSKPKIYNDEYLEQNFSNENSYEKKFLDLNMIKTSELKESLLGYFSNSSTKNSNKSQIKNNFLLNDLNSNNKNNLTNYNNNNNNNKEHISKTLNFDLENQLCTNHIQAENIKNEIFDNKIKNKNKQENYKINENAHVNQAQKLDKKPSLSEPDFVMNEMFDFSGPLNLIALKKNFLIMQTKLKFYFYKLQGFIYILFGCFLGTFVNFFYKYATQNEVNAITLLLYRGINLTLFSAFYLYLYFPVLKSQFDKTQIRSLISRALMNSIGMCLVLTSLNYIRLNTLELLLRTGNLMSVFLGYYLINEIVTRWDLLSLFGTFVGIIFILKPHFIFGEANEPHYHAGDSPFGIFLAVTCAFIIAVANILTKKLLSFFNEIYLILVMGISSIFFGIFLTMINNLEFGIGIFFVFYIFFVSIVEFFAVYYTFKSFKYESVTKLSPFFNSRIVFSVGITYVYFGQIDVYDLFGSSIILAIYIYSSYMKMK